MANQKILYLSQADVASIGLTMEEIIDVVEAAFREKAHGGVEMPPKLGVHSMPDAFTHAMPAYIPALKSMGAKWISCYPDNHKRDLPYVNGLIILNDVETGIPTALMDCVWITSKRTAAATAVAAKHLARPDSQSLGVLGAGVQGFSHLEALKTLFQIKTVVLYDVVPKQMDHYEKRAKEKFAEIEIVKATEPRQAVEGLDLIVTAGPILRGPHATIRAGWMSEGAFASLVDFDSYWHPDAMAETTKFVTDDLPQLEQYRQIGYFQGIPPVYAEVGELVTGKKPGREGESERTMTCNLGLAMNDIATASLVYRKALNAGIGTWLPL